MSERKAVKWSPSGGLRRIGAAEVKAFPLAAGGTIVAIIALIVILVADLGTLPRDVALAAIGIGLIGSAWGLRIDRNAARQARTASETQEK